VLAIFVSRYLHLLLRSVIVANVARVWAVVEPFRIAAAWISLNGSGQAAQAGIAGDIRSAADFILSRGGLAD
jgi:hypothetical protein